MPYAAPVMHASGQSVTAEAAAVQTDRHSSDGNSYCSLLHNEATDTEEGKGRPKKDGSKLWEQIAAVQRHQKHQRHHQEKLQKHLENLNANMDTTSFADITLDIDDVSEASDMSLIHGAREMSGFTFDNTAEDSIRQRRESVTAENTTLHGEMELSREDEDSGGEESAAKLVSGEKVQDSLYY